MELLDFELIKALNYTKKDADLVVTLFFINVIFFLQMSNVNDLDVVFVCNAKVALI